MGLCAVAPPAAPQVYCMSGSGPGRLLVTCGEDCDARLWDTERGTFKVWRLGWMGQEGGDGQVQEAGEDGGVMLSCGHLAPAGD